MKKRKISFLVCMLVGILCFSTIVGADEESGASVIDTVAQENIPQLIKDYYEKDNGREIEIHVKQNGILCVKIYGGYCAGNNMLFDGNRKAIPTQKVEEDLFYLKNVKVGDIFYLKLSNIAKDRPFSLTTIVYPDNVRDIEENKIYLQSGQEKYTYKYFSITDRSFYYMRTSPVFLDYKSNEYHYIQKKEKDEWKNTSIRQVSEADEHGRFEFGFGLKKGDYRIAIKTSTNQITLTKTAKQKMTSKYQTKKSKAQTIKLGKTNTNIYTASEKASRWYKVSRSAIKKNHYVKLSVNNNSGNVKYTIYKKGRSKALKSYTLSGTNSKTYRLNSGKGTYYVKVSKSGSKMNGQYSIQYK